MLAEQHKILIIEDEAQIRKFLRISLEAQNYIVTEVVNASAGIQQTTENSYDLIILDLGLPDMDGQQLITRLRQTLTTPIIVLSVRASENEKIQALDAGANDYVTKPFGIGELMARVRVLVRQHETVDDAKQLTVQDIELDATTRQVTQNKQLVHLSRKEFELLNMLLAKPGRILTHQQLLTTIWGQTFINETHYLRVLVGHLRQKLSDDPVQPRYIETIQGVGYRIKI